MLGEVLQRSVLICWSVCVPVVLLWGNVEPLLQLLHQDPLIVSQCARYLQLIAPTIFVQAVASNTQRYLLAQRIVKSGSICTIITAAFCPLFNWLLIYKLELGLDGAAAAFFCSNLLYALLLVGCVAWRDRQLIGNPRQTWPGWTWQAFRNWNQYLAYGLPAAAMICAEWWVFELVIFLAGTLSNAEVAVAVMGISFHVTCLAYMVPMSVGTAVNTVVANALGAGNGPAAQLAFRTGFSTVCVLQVLLACGVYLLRNNLATAFTSAPAVVELTALTAPVVALTVVADGLNSLLAGVLRGCGRQSWGACLNLISYFGLGFPLAYHLGVTLQLSTVGFWMGLAAASLLQVIIQLTVISRLDWGNEVKRAAQLVGSQSSPSLAGIS